MNGNKRLLNLAISELVIISIVLGSVLTAAPARSVVAAQPQPSAVKHRDADTIPSKPLQPSETAEDSFVYLPLIAQNYVSPAHAEAIIEPGVGGQVGSPDGKVRVLFTPEAVTQTVIARYTPSTPPTLPPGNLGVAGPAFDISAQTLDGTPVHDFPYQVVIIPATEITPAIAIVTPTVTIQVRYTSEDVWGLDLRELFLYTHDEPGQEWVRAPSAADQEQQLLVAEVEHLSKFVPMAPLAARSGGRAIAARNRLALDPDDDVGHASWPGVGEVREGPMAFRLAQEVRQRFEDNDCHLDVLITRDSDQQRFIPRTLRAELARNFDAEVFTTLAFNALTGSPWGYEGDGGVRAWARSGRPEDDALAVEFFNRIQEYTGRPHTQGVQHPSIYGEFNDPAAIPDSMTYAHIETLFLDHNYDWPVIDTEFTLIVDAAYAALATRLADMGLTCGEDNQPPPLPDPPSAERLQRLRDLGYQNYQRYGADPVSFSTGNHVVQVRLVRIPGRGDLDWDLTLTYNAQDGRDDLFGYGWSFPYNAHAQHYSDDSVGVALPDGRTYHYTWNGSGYDAPAGVFDRLEKSDEGWHWISPDELTLVFSETVDGFGILTEWRDRQGNALHFSHDLSGQNNWQDDNPVPRPPLTGIQDDAGRTITVQSDANGHITGLALFDGRAFAFQYDAEGNLTGITDANGGTRRFQYDARHRMTHEWDEEDYLYLQNMYDDRDRVVEQIDASGTHSYLDYNPVGRVTTFTDNLGNQEVYHWDELNRVTGEQDGSGAQVSNEYEGDYNLISRTDTNGNTTYYTYDERGNLISRSDPLDQYSFYTSDVTRWAYDEHNQVISKTNALGHTWLYEYDGQGNLVHTTAPDGSETWATYNAWGQPTSITDANDHTTHYEYDDYGNRLRTTDHEGNTSESEYDAAGRETHYTDANSHSVTFQYDDNDNITRITDPKNVPSTFEYDGNDLLTRSVDRRGGERLYHYDENLKLIAERDQETHWTYYGYDALYRREVMTDALGNAAHYAYDEAGRLFTITDPTGAVTRYEYDEAGNRVAVVDSLGHRTRMIYDASNRLKFLIDAAGNRTEYCYDAEDQLIRTIGPRGEVTDYTYDALGRLIAVKDPLGEITEYEYDAVGNRTAVIDPLGYRTDYTYDALDRLTAIARPELPDSVRPTTEFAYDAVGNTLVITGPRGFATTYAYDANDNVVAITDPLGGQTRYTYDSEDAPVTVTDPNGHTTATTYNGVGLATQVQDALGYTTALEYDAAYNLVQQVNALGQATAFEYDPLGRLTQVTDPLGNATGYARDALGRTTAATDANGHATAYDYDALGRLIAVTDPLSGTTRYTYDRVGNLAVITDANNHVTLFEYNFLNQLKREINPLDHIWEYAYDPAGRLVRRVDAMWQATYYDYDSNGRLTAIRYGSTPPTQEPVTFTYDLEGNETTMCDALGCTAHAYDPRGRRTSTTDWLGRSITRTYDAVGNLTGLTYPNPSTGSGQGGYQVTYAYNANDWLTTFTDPHGDSSAFEYNSLGQVTRIQHPNDTVATFTYDDAGRLTGIDHRKLGAAQPQSAYAYAMDKVGNRTQVVETRAAFDGSDTTVALTHDYEYDALDRLIRAATDTPTSDTAYAFDAVGNRLSKTGSVLSPDPGIPELPVAPRPEAVNYTYNEANQMLTAGDTEFEYNPNGDRVLEISPSEVISYTFDREDRLVGVVRSTVITSGTLVLLRPMMVATYTYDGYGRRALKQVSYPSGITPTQVITYLYDGLDIIGAQLDVSGTVTETYYYLTSSSVASPRRLLAMERLPNPDSSFVGDCYWYQIDGLVSVVALIDRDGMPITLHLYNEYGSPLASDELQIFAYTGQDYDPETGFHHFHTRYYDSETGTWMTQDDNTKEYSQPQRLHRYAYVANNPISRIDILGLDYLFISKSEGMSYYYDGAYDTSGTLIKTMKVRVGPNSPTGKMYIWTWVDSVQSGYGYGWGPYIAKMRYAGTDQAVDPYYLHGDWDPADPSDDNNEPWPDCDRDRHPDAWTCQYDGAGCIAFSDANITWLKNKWWENGGPSSGGSYPGDILVEIGGVVPPNPNPPTPPSDDEDHDDGENGSYGSEWLFVMVLIMLSFVGISSLRDQRRGTKHV